MPENRQEWQEEARDKDERRSFHTVEESADRVQGDHEKEIRTTDI